MQQEQQAEQKAEQPTEQRPNVAKPFNPPAWLVKEARDRAMAASDTDKKVKYPYVMKPLNPSAWVVKEARAASNTDEEVQRPYVVKPFNPPAWVVKEARDNAARLGIDPAAVARIVKSNTSPFIITKPTKVDQESNRAISRQAVVALPETNLHTNSTDQTKSLLTRGPESTQ
ncbi:hypothetical protein GQ44DRAFT_714337 [Phaeosphaeriaceae sp. PMI808]|nr:hypothetical protein GQ44DRAFT_714337 [Phaeosphaeriaceae sp. PMI808]